MSETITELYQKYNEANASLEDDRYFQYLFTMFDAGQNTILQQHQIMHKIVDEEWLNIVEDTLDSINTIIENPRRFIKTNEEVVPVELAKKITGDSVKHLSQNTQFIDSVKDGEIHPSKILNVSVEESFDLYENRFIYHLIQRLVTFIDKRTDLIFWSTGDEIKDMVVLKSHVDDAYEQIDYKLEVSIKDKQNHMEADSENMEVYKRIDRVRRLVMTLRGTTFCDIMKGCAKVHSPIQRTNLMIKNRDYKKCYQLWQFLENYDGAGYTIDTNATTLEYDEDYLFSMYTSAVNNYTTFKTLLEADRRDIDEAKPLRTRHLKPQFLRKLDEDGFELDDLPEVPHVEQVVEEVTAAQITAEEQLQDQLTMREDAEKALQDAQAAQLMAEEAADKLRLQLEEIQSRIEAAERDRKEAEDAAEAAKQAAEAALAAQAAAIAAQQLAESERDAANLERDHAITEKEEAVSYAQSKVAEAEQTMTMAKQTVEDAEAEVSRVTAEADAKVRQAEETAEAEKTRAAGIEAACAATVAAATKAQDDAIADRDHIKAEAEKVLLDAQKTVEEVQNKQKLADEARMAAEVASEKARTDADQARQEADQAIRLAQAEAEKIRIDCDSRIQKAEAEADKRNQKAAEQLAQAEADIKKAKAAQKEAESIKQQSKYDADKAIEEAQRDVREMKEVSDTEVKAARLAQKRAEKRAENEEKLRKEIEERAGASDVSGYIRASAKEYMQRRRMKKK